jgi:hypothetical protein
MKKIAKALYNEPVVFLGVLTGVLAAAGASGLIPGWVPVVEVAAATPLTRRFTRAAKRR